MNEQTLLTLKRIICNSKPHGEKTTADKLLAASNKKRILECLSFIFDEGIFDFSSAKITELTLALENLQWTIMKDKDWKELTERTAQAAKCNTNQKSLSNFYNKIDDAISKGKAAQVLKTNDNTEANNV
jgi:hypothetical protein